MEIKSYRGLLIWQKSMLLAKQVYQLSQSFPKEETYGLTNQIRRACVSVPSNIAEGHARRSSAEFRNFLSIANGSLAEVDTQQQLAADFGYITTSESQSLCNLIIELRKMITALQSKLSAKAQEVGNGK